MAWWGIAILVIWIVSSISSLRDDCSRKRTMSYMTLSLLSSITVAFYICAFWMVQWGRVAGAVGAIVYGLSLVWEVRALSVVEADFIAREDVSEDVKNLARQVTIAVMAPAIVVSALGVAKVFGWM